LGKFINYVIKNKITGTLDLATNRLTSLKKLIDLLEKDAIKNKLKIIDKKNKDTLKCPLAKNILLKKIKITTLEAGFKKTFVFYRKNIKLINKNS
jgi:hypothetical protein